MTADLGLHILNIDGCHVNADVAVCPVAPHVSRHSDV